MEDMNLLQNMFRHLSHAKSFFRYPTNIEKCIEFLASKQ